MEAPYPKRRPAPATAGALPPGWPALAKAAGLVAEQPLVLALSGGADSCYLLQLLAESEPRPRVRVVHVAHALRGAESEDDALFCAARCAALNLEFERVDAPLDPHANALEERARV
ncbi:MAG: hypothetical protein FJ299_16475, partial [Planctomycetes bacterium]|nr:hypothetical protein [Planctomycetota bacterium]